MYNPSIVKSPLQVSAILPAASDYDQLKSENTFLRAKCAELQGQVWDLSGRLAHALR